VFISNAARIALAAALGLSASSGLAQTVRPGGSSPFTVAPIYNFSGGADGGGSPSNLTVDSDGALYGTTPTGGGSNKGVVFKLTPPAPGKTKWTETVLYGFSGVDGASPEDAPILDSRGGLYGASFYGGVNNDGVAFKLTPPVAPSTQWTEAKIFDFTLAVGINPSGPFVRDSAGALYGTALFGGFLSGGGTVYKLTPPVPPATQWTGAALYVFSDRDGGMPGGMLVMDTSGALYGAARYGGSGHFGTEYGFIFKLTPPGANCTPMAPNLWCESVLYSFSAGADGGGVYGGVTMDSHGALYGAASQGGAYGYGLLFKLTPPTPPATQWTKTTLYSFTGGADGGTPLSAPVLVGGALYGTTALGGTCAATNCGAIYRLRPPVPPSTQWTEDTLWSFTGGADGGGPVAGLTFAPANFGLGVAVYGATASGTIFTLQCAPRARLISGGALQTACAQ
jgi:uncharacterized repeat protein (TIGR03803 family)